jgi:hypothetical protein
MHSIKICSSNLFNKLVIIFIKLGGIIKFEKQGGLGSLEDPRGEQDKNG